jgi:heat shock transcription factor
MPQQQYQYQQIPNTTDFPDFDFSAPLPGDPTYSDPSAFDSNNFSYDLNTAQPQTFTGAANNLAPVPSTELVRRSRNQQLAPQNGQQEQWNGFGNAGAPNMDEEDEQDLDVKVALAKKDAQGKRKQIPPFVQKLSR